MVNGLENKSVRWQFVQSLEPPRVVHVRTTDMLSKENLYAQVTVRLHTQQVKMQGLHLSRKCYVAFNAVAIFWWSTL